MSIPTSTQESTSTRIDPELVAKRINSAVAAAHQAIEVRERYRREASMPDPQAIFRRLEAIEAAIYWLNNQIQEAGEVAA